MSSSPFRTSLIAIAAACLTPIVAGAAAPLVDKETGVTFPPTQNIDGTNFQCLGAGVRKVLIVNVYSAAYCLEAGSMQPVLDYVSTVRGSTGKPSDLAHKLEKDKEFYRTLVETPGGKLLVMHLVRDVTRKELEKAFRESLAKVLPPEKVNELVATIPGNGRNGEEIRIWSAGSTLTIDIAGNAKKLDDAEIAQKIWWVWLGKDSVSPALKKSIANRLAQGPSPTARRDVPEGR